jgi:hypothetical protein
MRAPTASMKTQKRERTAVGETDSDAGIRGRRVEGVDFTADCWWSGRLSFWLPDCEV